MNFQTFYDQKDENGVSNRDKLAQRQHIIRRVDTTAKDRSFEAVEGHHDGVVVVDGKLIGFGIHMGALTGGMRTTRTPCRLA